MQSPLHERVSSRYNHLYVLAAYGPSHIGKCGAALWAQTSTAVSNKGLSMEFRTEARFASVAHLFFKHMIPYFTSQLDFMELRNCYTHTKSIINSCYSLEWCQWKINGLFCNYWIIPIDELLSALGFHTKRPIWLQNLKIGKCLRHHPICIWPNLSLPPASLSPAPCPCYG